MNHPIVPDARIVIAVVAVLAALILLVWIRRILSGGPEAMPYRPVESLLTPAELNFFHALTSATAGMPLAICMKVRLLDLLQIPRGTQSHAAWRGRVQSKHVDFVLCDAQTLRPRLVIELDDATHRRRDRANRDAFVDGVMDSIGLPILHVPCAARYSPADVRTDVQSRLAPR